ncbi:F-box/FBD/LRR-repeat protein At4g00160-like isoform X2 [Lotus japonicus]|uniref:F-box/FBD/LRR-repeat protein At4g00160-like isoform X2 n=1 Tax=Lotus japonicus TaxID=34305 RepID=UPI00258BFC70|nr:F-box/FBD/LRR-repeat protein At4g00160-like isoform X2 [Lotus japonicus]
MEDRLSSLPEELICHILSFLPTKQTIATSVLSKKWKPLWRSVPTLYFDDTNSSTRTKEDCARIVQSVYAFINSRDQHQPIQNLRLTFNARHYDPTSITEWVNVAVERKLQHLDLSLGLHPINLSSIFTCTTLVVLKLQGLVFKPFLFYSVNLPFLKVLHLQLVSFSKCGCLAQLLSACPVLEDFKARCTVFKNYFTDREFRTLPKLVRADISMRNPHFLLMEVVNNVEFLRISQMDFIHQHYGEGAGPYVLPMFHNLTHIELVYTSSANDWLQVVVELLKHCPKLHVLVINQEHFLGCMRDGFEEVGDWQYPPFVPDNTLLFLKRCYLNDYRGTKDAL